MTAPVAKITIRVAAKTGGGRQETAGLAAGLMAKIYGRKDDSMSANLMAEIVPWFVHSLCAGLLLKQTTKEQFGRGW